MMNFKKKNRRKLGLIITLEALAILILAYLIALPFYPALKYKIDSSKNENIDFTDIDEIKKITEKKLETLPAPAKITETNTHVDSINATTTETKNTETPDIENSEPEENADSEATEPVNAQNEQLMIIPNTLIIPKIGVDIPIIEGDDENYGLDRGAWKLPKSSTPDETGNMIITGHRFKYLPPSNTTFYLFHKLEIGDIASVIWNNESYYYEIKEIKTVTGDDISILKQTKTPTLTMYTCDPIYSTENRLVIIADLIEK